MSVVRMEVSMFRSSRSSGGRDKLYYQGPCDLSGSLRRGNGASGVLDFDIVICMVNQRITNVFRITKAA